MGFSNLIIPEELIAFYPEPKRDKCKLFCINKTDGKFSHLVFSDVISLFKKNDLLIFNDTKVINARLHATKETGGMVEILLLRALSASNWQCLLKGKKIKQGSKLKINNSEIMLQVIKIDSGYYEIEFPDTINVYELLDKLGEIPLPPYIRREPVPSDYEMYQTVFAKRKGSVASPTASLHFTNDLIEQIKTKGVQVRFVTLHVGYGTFSPVRDPETHVMHEEFFCIDKSVEDAVKECKKNSGRVWAVGTTVVRTLETAFDSDGSLNKATGWSALFIRDPYKFKVVDCMITNFHHPTTSLMYLVSAFAGEDNIISAYKEAVDKKYRMLSYGDSMAIIC